MACTNLSPILRQNSGLKQSTRFGEGGPGLLPDSSFPGGQNKLKKRYIFSNKNSQT